MADKHKEQEYSLPSHVSMDVLDRVIKLSTENNASYTQMVSALDTVAANSMEMADAIEKLSKTIEDEQLAEVVNGCMIKIRDEVSAVRALVGIISVPKYNLLAAIGSVFEFEKESEQGIQNKAKAVLWLLDIIGIFQRNKILFSFLAGALLVAILGSAGMKIRDILVFIVTKI